MCIDWRAIEDVPVPTNVRVCAYFPVYGTEYLATLDETGAWFDSDGFPFDSRPSHWVVVPVFAPRPHPDIQEFAISDEENDAWWQRYRALQNPTEEGVVAAETAARRAAKEETP